MWDYELNAKEKATSAIRVPQLPRGTRIIPTIWQEHCTECAIPDCYSTCSLYEEKKDGSCRRFVGGIRQVQVHGRLTQSAAIEFKRWGKLESPLGYATFGPFSHKILNFINYLSCRITEGLDSLFRTISFSQAFSWRRDRLIRNLNRWGNTTNRGLKLIAVIENKASPVNLFVEMSVLNLRIHTTHMMIPHGISEHTVDITPHTIKEIGGGQRLIRILPAGDDNVELTFHRLEMVATEVSNKLPNKESPKNIGHAQFVKCVIWDLDNTLWKGVITEDDPSQLVMLRDATEILELLDSKGILNAIVSKNNYADAWEQVVRFGLSKYFVASEINWDQKSINLEKISNILNISTDSFLFIDDSDFELGEVTRFLPDVRTLNSITLADIQHLEYLNPPISPESKNRRQMYKQDFIRNERKEQYGSNYLDYLRNCKLNLEISTLHSQVKKDRAFELLSRTNQLNLSGRKFTKTEFVSSISNVDNIWLTGTASDQYGEYGQILIAKLVNFGNNFVITDLAISCRVMERLIEVSFVEFLRKNLCLSSGLLFANFIETGKNLPLKNALSAAGFQFTTNGEYAFLECGIQIPNSEIVLVSSTNFLIPPETK